jgi:cytochrome c oxidase subunit 2
MKFLTDFPLFPPAASTSAHRVDALFLGWIVVAGIVAVGLFGAMLFCAIKYREGSRADRTPVTLSPHILEWTWTVTPLVIFLAMFCWGTWVYYVNYNAPQDADEIYVVAKQWMWKVQHVGGQREINELHLPLGRPVKLVMTSQDVIHSFFVPAFRMKQDVLPGRYTTEWFEPTQTGEYHLFCAEYCGTNHAAMIGRVVVMTPTNYQAWLAGLHAGPDLAAQGEAVFRRAGCTGCHGPSATVHAPKLQGIYGKPQPLQGGGFAVADEGYLRDSILLPSKQVVAGYAPVMPSFKGQLGEDELVSLVAYIKSLGAATDIHTDRPAPERSAAAL